MPSRSIKPGHDPNAVAFRGLGEPFARRAGNRLGHLHGVLRRADHRDRLGKADHVELQPAGLVDLLAEQVEILLGRAVLGPQIDRADLHLAGRRRRGATCGDLLPAHRAPLRPFHFQREPRAVGLLGSDQHVAERAAAFVGRRPAEHHPGRVQRLARLGPRTRTISER